MKIKVVQKIIAVMCAASISGSCVVTTVGAHDDSEAEKAVVGSLSAPLQNNNNNNGDNNDSFLSAPLQNNNNNNSFEVLEEHPINFEMLEPRPDEIENIRAQFEAHFKSFVEKLEASPNAISLIGSEDSQDNNVGKIIILNYNNNDNNNSGYAFQVIVSEDSLNNNDSNNSGYAFQVIGSEDSQDNNNNDNNDNNNDNNGNNNNSFEVLEAFPINAISLIGSEDSQDNNNNDNNDNMLTKNLPIVYLEEIKIN